MKARKYWIAAVCALCIGMTGCGDAKSKTQAGGEQAVNPALSAQSGSFQGAKYVQVDDYLFGDESLTIDEKLEKVSGVKFIFINLSDSEFRITKPEPRSEGIKIYSGSVARSGDQLSFHYQNLQWDFNKASQKNREQITQKYGSPVLNVSVSEDYPEDNSECYDQKKACSNGMKQEPFV
ncbi:MAG: hypothetical protein IJ060_03340 [Oscillospiraceae bacterium]|nr:hypothetical protein [Oscillospiraceae bacterium]